MINWNLYILFFSLQTGKGAPYYVGAQTLPRGMYTDRNKNAVGELILSFT